MLHITIKWGKESYMLEFDPTWTGLQLKQQVESLTHVPAARQKIMGVKDGSLRDEVIVTAVGIKEGSKLLLIGSVEPLTSVTEPIKPVQFVEDMKGGFSVGDDAFSNGLRNTGNTCYLNSAIQALRIIPQVREIASQGTSSVELALSRVYRELDVTKDPVTPFLFWTAFIGQFPQFGHRNEQGFPEQQDSQEALSCTIELLGQTILARGLGKYEHLFRGEFVQQKELLENPTVDTEGGSGGISANSEVVVPTAEMVKMSTVPFAILQCSLSNPGQTLEAVIGESLTSHVEMPSPTQDHNTTYRLTSRFRKLPEYLVVQLVRFSWRNDTKNKAKNLKPITFPLVLDVFQFCDPEVKKKMEPERHLLKEARDYFLENRKRQRTKAQQENEEKRSSSTTASVTTAPLSLLTVGSTTSSSPVENNNDKASFAHAPAILGNTNGVYELCSVITHKGRDADGGHYVCWARKGATWLVFDDENVAPVTEEDVLRLRGVGEAHIAYVLIYRSRAPETNMLPLKI